MPGTAIELTHDEYRAVWQFLGLGARHWNMDLPGLPELTEQERRAQVGSTIDGLRARGLADRRGVTPDVEDPLRLLAHPALELSGSVYEGSARMRLLAGSRGESAALAILDEHRLLVLTCRARELCAAVAIQLPDRPAGPGSSVSVPSELLERPASDGKPGLTGQQLENRLVQGGVRPEDARSFAAMIRGPKPAGGSFSAARRDRSGARHTARVTLVYLATERGGYTAQPVRGPDGRAWTTLAPATLAHLAQRLNHLLNGIRAD
ncbi:MAG TPA: ESX secretion-associated protein EspG [Pseudonocardiaceae bacterium]|nr:ESX secretion-associated protein EspG [Pseudonocardiaceae bacterium]